MADLLRILILEDQEDDALLITNRLRRDAMHFTWARVETEPTFLAQLQEPWDIILADYKLPQFTALRALHLLRERELDIPFIVVTGYLGEEAAVECMRQGADDYLLKDRLARLSQAISRALEAKDTRAAKRFAEANLRASELRFRSLVQNSSDIISILDGDGTIRYQSPAANRILGFAPEKMICTCVFDYIHPDDCAAFIQALKDLSSQSSVKVEFRMRHADGSWVDLDAFGSNLIDADDIQGIVINARDITERKRAEERIRAAAARAEALVRVTSRLNMRLDLATVLETVCAEAAHALNVPAANVVLFDERRDMLYHAGAYGLPADFLSRAKPISRTFYDETVRQFGPIIIIPDIRMLPATVPNADLYAEMHMRTAIGMSMYREGRLIGLLNISTFHEVREFNDDELALLRGFTDQAALAIANARLLSQVEQRLRQIRTLHTIDVAISASLDLRITLAIVLDQVTAQLDVHAAAVMLFNPETYMLEYAAMRGFRNNNMAQAQVRLGQGIAGQAVFERRRSDIIDLRDHPDRFVRRSLLVDESFVAYCAVPLIAKGEVAGVLEVFHRKPLDPDPEWWEFLEALAASAAIAIDNAGLFDRLQRSNDNLAVAYDATIEGWARALDLRDKETEGHSQRVTNMTMRLARAMGLSDEALVHIRRGALLHDIGKMGVPDGILLKPGPLTDEEWVVMRKHPVYAYELLAPIAFLRPALDIPYCHHEKWDGTGYPRGLKGEQIPLAARIFAVVDVWDALRSNRPYRSAWPVDRVQSHIQAQAGSHFDPQIVKIFLSMSDI